MASSWQKTKLKRKTGDRRKELENHFGIQTKPFSEEIKVEPKKLSNTQKPFKQTIKQKKKSK